MYPMQHYSINYRLNPLDAHRYNVNFANDRLTCAVLCGLLRPLLLPIQLPDLHSLDMCLNTFFYMTDSICVKHHEERSAVTAKKNGPAAFLVF